MSEQPHPKGCRQYDADGNLTGDECSRECEVCHGDVIVETGPVDVVFGDGEQVTIDFGAVARAQEQDWARFTASPFYSMLMGDFARLSEEES